MRIIKKCLLLITVFMFFILSAVNLAACGKDNEKIKDNDDIFISDGNHNVSIKKTDKLMLSRGKSDYKIVYPEDANSEELMAKGELQQLFKEATDLILPALTDAQLECFNADNDKYIFIGDNKFAIEQNIVPAESEYGKSGYVIKSKGDSIFICGSNSTGTLFGTYKFLEYILNYDYFYTDIYHIDTGIADIPLKNYDVSIIYDIPFSRLVYGYTNNRQNDLKFSVQYLTSSAVNGVTGHASTYWLPADIYFTPGETNYHPEWFEEGCTKDSYRYQLCFTARGDKEGTYKLMVETMAKTAIEVFKKDLSACELDCSMADRNAWCNCDGCKAVIAKYGAESATQVLLLNDVAEYIDKWMQSEEGKPYAREYYLSFYAYFCAVTAPKAIDDDIKLSKRIMPIIADVNMDITSSPHAESNKATRQYYVDWGKVAQNVSAYTYIERYNEYLSPIETINDMQAWFQFYKSQNVSSIWNLGNCYEFGFATGWGGLEVYLNGKLSYDVNSDINYYIDKYFTYVYEDAASTMKQMFNEWRAQDEYNAANFSDYSGQLANYININKEIYFSKTLLEHWLGLFDKALSHVEYLKTANPTKYVVIEKMIKGERVAYEYTYFMIYRYKLPQTKLINLCKMFLEDIETTGITRYCESGGNMNEISYIKGILKGVLEQYE